jgi:hypothetical protein
MYTIYGHLWYITLAVDCMYKIVDGAKYGFPPYAKPPP